MTKRILMIDDEGDLRDIVELAIDCFTDWRVDTAATGMEGIEKASIQSYGAILLDISMPDMDGFQVHERLRSLSIARDTPVIILTARPRSGDRQRFAAMNVAGIIEKPFASETIPDKIASILGWTI